MRLYAVYSLWKCTPVYIITVLREQKWRSCVCSEAHVLMLYSLFKKKTQYIFLTFGLSDSSLYFCLVHEAVPVFFSFFWYIFMLRHKYPLHHSYDTAVHCLYYISCLIDTSSKGFFSHICLSALISELINLNCCCY